MISGVLGISGSRPGPYHRRSSKVAISGILYFQQPLDKALTAFPYIDLEDVELVAKPIL
jgi:hypothetical protein